MITRPAASARGIQIFGMTIYAPASCNTRRRETTCLWGIDVMADLGSGEAFQAIGGWVDERLDAGDQFGDQAAANGARGDAGMAVAASDVHPRMAGGGAQHRQS